MRTLATLTAAALLAVSAHADTQQTDRAHPNPGSQQAKIEKAMQQPTQLGGAVVNPKYTIVDAIKHSNMHTSLTGGLQAAKLGTLLYGPGPYTVFAPTNDAFARMKPEDLAALQANHKDLRKVLTYHVVPGRINSVDLAKAITEGKGEATLTTVNGNRLRATMGPNNMILLWDDFGNNAEITQANVVGSNGVVHVLDKVLLPAVTN
jgi:uncharacterized surface protein with fasciclin (FAS1) repeats